MLALEWSLALGRTSTSDYLSLAAACWTPATGAVFAVLLWGMVAVEPIVAVPRWGMTLGSASYAIYLVHVPVNTLMQRVAQRLPDGWRAWGAGHLLLVLCGVTAGIAVHWIIEKPITRWLRARLLPPLPGTGPALANPGPLGQGH